MSGRVRLGGRAATVRQWACREIDRKGAARQWQWFQYVVAAAVDGVQQQPTMLGCVLGWFVCLQQLPFEVVCVLTAVIVLSRGGLCAHCSYLTILKWLVCLK